MSKRPGGADLRIEVKARVAGSDTFTITRTEVLLAPNASENHRLVLVSAHPDGPHLDELRYIGNVSSSAEPSWLNDFGLVSQTMSWDYYWDLGSTQF